MLLKDLSTPFETKRVIMHGADHNKAVCHNKSMQQIQDNLYRGEDEKDPGCSWTNCELYAYYPDFKIGLMIGYMDIDNLVEDALRLYQENRLETSASFVSMIEDRIAQGVFISNTQVELMKHLSPTMVNDCYIARARFAEARQQIELERKKKREAEEQKYVEQKNQKAEQSIADAIKIIKDGGRLINKTIEIFRSRYDSSSYAIINHIARLYDVKIPIKTQGWINSTLAEITITDGKVAGGRLYGKNQSTTIYKYMNALIEAVKKSDISS